MKKRKKGRTLSRTKDQRLALLRTLSTSLIMHKRIKTTLAKAKELRPFAERLATRAKKATDTQTRANALKLLKKDLALKTAKELAQMAELFKERKGGYLRIVKMQQRSSDSAKMALVEWVDVKPQKIASNKKQDDAKDAKEQGKTKSKSDKKAK